MIYITAGVLLTGIFISWAFYRIVVKKEINPDDLMAGVVYALVLLTFLFFLFRA